MSLHLIEFPLSLKQLHLWAGARQLGRGFDEGMVLHHLLGETFGPAVLQPFRLFVAPGAQTGSVYGYSAQDAPALQEQATASLTPDLAEVVDLARLRSIPRPISTWKEGQRVGFDVRLRPVVRLASTLIGRNEAGAEVKIQKGAEVDAFLAGALRDAPQDRETVYLRWLADRLGAAGSLDLDASRLARFQRVRVIRGGRSLEGPDAIVHGTLTVGDPKAFAIALAQGIGRHRSYGYGMLLLRPPQRLRPC